MQGASEWECAVTLSFRASGNAAGRPRNSFAKGSNWALWPSFPEINNYVTPVGGR
jgi:hypothetical protein